MPQPDPISAPDFSGVRLRHWLSEILLPFWAVQGFDAAHGAFVEKFEPSDSKSPGLPTQEDYTRVRVQARQIYVFSHAAATGISDVGLAAARRAFAFLEEHAWDRAEGGWFHRLRCGGGVLDPMKDSYDHAFLLLAMAWLYRATGEPAVLRRAHQTAAFLEQALARRYGGVFNGYAEHQVSPGGWAPLPRRQNPHMHMLEAFLALHEVSGDALWLDHARQMYALFNRHFFDAEAGQLIEFFDRDWREMPQEGTRLREPGHFFEWTWLLHRYATLAGDDSAAGAMRPLYDWAWDRGVDSDGVVFEVLDAEGRVLNGGSKRLWPQTEAAKACLAVHERFGNAEALERAGKLLGALFTTFAGLDRPDWREQVDRGGKVIRDGMPSSSLYHLYLASAEAVRVLPAV
ncbi:AGE family epimerase/isomerase [Pelagibius sp. 7325]|uniref:AGE family epimerase/isomerase n=1 Tax=Pelagibius sp. 7325 TaxID=3131994 RepID=UPI0030EB50DF